MSLEHCSIAAELVNQATPHVVVSLVEREGSVPADVGAVMIVTEEGRLWGTVGGGKVEAKAIEHARSLMLRSKAVELVHWNLNTDLRMTCGGRVRLFFQVASIQTWPIVIFGAGHVAQALSRLLITLPCQVTVIDSREEWIEKLPRGVTASCKHVSEALVQSLDQASQVLSLTKGHSEDIKVLEAIAESQIRFPFVGVIGSRSKAAVLKRELRQRGIDPEDLPFHCPVGLPIGSNHPGEIALSIAAQLLEQRGQPSSPADQTVLPE